MNMPAVKDRPVLTRKEAVRMVVSRARQAVYEFAYDEVAEMKQLEEACVLLGLQEE